MKVIVLTGPSSSGKTTTLKIVYEYLKHINDKETRMFHYLDPIQKDFFDVLIIRSIVVVIITQGDFVRRGSEHGSIFTLLDEARAANASIVICPFSTKNDEFDSQKYIEKIKKYDCDAIFIEKDCRTKNQKGNSNDYYIDANEEDAKKIKEEVEKILNGLSNEEHD